MAASQTKAFWPSKLLTMFHLFTPGNLAFFLRSILDVWGFIEKMRERIGYRGMYEILDYDATLEIMDPEGKEAWLIRHQVIRFLQDNVVAIHDHAWGEGDNIFAEYHCQPGVPVDFYKDSSKYNILISLRETKNRGDVIDLWIERLITGGLTEEEEYLETDVDHLTDHMKVSIIFPQERPCRRAILTQKSSKDTMPLEGRNFSNLTDGRQVLTYETRHPRLNDLYTIKWRW